MLGGDEMQPVLILFTSCHANLTFDFMSHIVSKLYRASLPDVKGCAFSVGPYLLLIYCPS